MKTALASAVAVVVLVAGTPAVSASPDAFPPWLCKVFPMFCTRT